MKQRESFAKRLLSIRTLKGWTQTELANKCGMHLAAISHFECGRRRPSMKNLIKLADALECPADDFYYLPAKEVK